MLVFGAFVGQEEDVRRFTVSRHPFTGIRLLYSQIPVGYDIVWQADGHFWDLLWLNN